MALVMIVSGVDVIRTTLLLLLLAIIWRVVACGSLLITVTGGHTGLTDWTPVVGDVAGVRNMRERTCPYW